MNKIKYKYKYIHYKSNIDYYNKSFIMQHY